MKVIQHIKRNKVAIIILVITAFTAYPRLLSINKGLPYLHHYDEPLIINGALNGLKGYADDIEYTSILPRAAEVVYGGFLRYTCMAGDVIYYSYLRFTDPRVFSLDDIKTDMWGDQPLTVSHPGFFYWNRVYQVIISVLGFVFLFLLGKYRLGTFNGLIAVSILAVIYQYYHWSSHVNTNITLSTWTITTVYFAVKYNHTKKYKYLIISLIFSGLAMSTKMTGAATILIPATTAFLNYNILKHESFTMTVWKAFYLCLIPVAVFLLFNPSVYLNTGNFFYWMKWLREIYSTGSTFLQKQPGWDHFSYQTAQLKVNLLDVYFYLAIVGIILGLISLKNSWKKNIPKNTDVLILLVFPVFYLVYVTTQYSIAYHRNFLLLYPFLSLFAAEALIRPLKVLVLRTPKVMWLYKWVSGIVLIVICFYNFRYYKQIFSTAKAINQSSDTRTLAVDFIRDLSKKEQIFVGIEHGLKMSLNDLWKIDRSFGYFEIGNIEEAQRGFTHLLMPDYQFQSDSLVAFSSDTIDYIENKIKIGLIREFKGAKINYFHDLTPWVPIVNPSIRIIKGSEYPPPQLENFIFPITTKQSLVLIDHRPVRIYKGLIRRGNYKLSLTLSGSPALGIYPEMEVIVNDTSLDSTVTGYDEFEFKQFNFRIDQDGINNIYLRMTNDYYNPEQKEDRNIYIRNLELKESTDF